MPSFNILYFPIPGLVREVESDNDVYVINVNNTYTSIRLNFDGSPLVNASTPDIISCDETRTFWVSWRDRIIGILQFFMLTD